MKMLKSNLNILTALFCVCLFAMTAPFTRIAALSLAPSSIILLRILVAAVVCLVFVIYDRWIPPVKALPGIIGASIGAVVGFNSLMAYGLKEVPASHAAVALAGLPMATSIYSIFRDRLKPSYRFWIFSLLGTLLSVCFFFFLNVKEILQGDMLLLLSVLSAAFGYVEGGRSSREYGGARTMSWAVLITLPFCIPLAFFEFRDAGELLTSLSMSVVFSVLYVGLISQSLGMFLWFRVLGKGPMEKIAMVQLLQPFITLIGAIVLLDEKVISITWLIALLVAMCVMGTNHERQKLEVN